MLKSGLFVRLEAKPGKEGELETLLRNGVEMVQEEPGTTAWFATRLGRSTYGIFDVFPDEQGRREHLSGRLAAALKEKAPDLLASPPSIENADVLAVKLSNGNGRRATPKGERVPMQVGSELRIRNTGEIILDNPEVLLAEPAYAADAMLSYRFDESAGTHVLKLLEPVASHEHMMEHRPND